ncbi:RHS repeat domain-containing protein [Flavobacterium sp.]|uniref:RHS repeat domain-containing protein n=1 Tax=Flavobacterium sp. TaxID=239 RepID=UPI003D0D3CE6
MKFKLLLLLSFLINNTYSQENSSSVQPPKISPLPPDVSALFKYTEIPVSNTTGIPNITIPIHEIKLKKYSLPINISYHSSGIIIDEVAGKIGLGWSLNAGGMIYQDVIGKPDNLNNRYHIPQDRELHPEDVPNSCNIITNEDYNLLQNFSLGSGGSDIDSEPDIYFYSAGDKNGKFFFDNNNVAHTIPESDVKIVRDLGGIIIYDEMGVKYTYRTSSLNKAMWWISFTTLPSTGATSGETDSYSYYLTEIETPENEKIFFTYNDYNYEYKNPASKTWKKRPFLGLDEATGCTNLGQFDSFPLEIKETIESSTFIRGKSISKIVTNSQSIDFIYENCPRLDLPPTSGLSSYSPSTTGDFALKKIKVSDYNSVKINEFVFNYSYFNLNNYQPCISQTNIDLMNSYRLKLESVVKNNIEPYSFQYYSPINPYYSILMPGRLSTSYDNWNRFNYNTGGDFGYDPIFNPDGVNREPDLDSTLSGVLKQIKYPTGGVTRFEYELNNIFESKTSPPTRRNESLYLNGRQEIDGQTNEIQNLVKTFEIKNIWNGVVDYSCYINSGAPTSTDWVDLSLYDHQTKSYFQLPGCSNQGKYIYNLSPGLYTLYVSGVTEGGGATFSWYESSNEIIYSNYSIGGLRIKEITSFDKEGNLEPSLKKKYTYTSNENPTKSSGKVLTTPRNSFIETKIKNCCIGIFPKVVAHYYTVLQNKIVEPLSNLNGYHIMYTDVQIYDENNKANVYTTFKYNFTPNDNNFYSQWPITPSTSLDFLRGDLIEKIDYSFTNGSFNKIEENSYEYFSNYNGQFFNPTFPGYNYCIGLKLTTLASNFSCTPGVCIPSKFQLGYYKLYSVRKYMTKQVKTTYDLNGNNPVTTTTNYNYENLNHSQLTSQVTFSSEGKTLEKKFFYAKDSQMAAQPFVNEMKDKNMIAIPLDYETYNGTNKLSEQLTIYDRSAATSNLLLPGKIYTAKFPNVLPTILDNRNLEKKISYDLYDASGNILQYTLENGIPVSVIWGYNKTLPVAKIENATNAQIASALGVSNVSVLNETNLDAINALRNDASFVNAMITTYTHIPLVGVSTITDPKGDKITYTYDAFGRLQFVKDKNDNLLSQNQYNYKQ